ncbi:hypothetical protein N9Q58_04135 [Polaribacter sp.]|nr:hypothetical protein [Polaribacter sp.]
MKNIKFITLFFLSIFMTFMSCEDSEDASDVDYNITANTVVTTLSGTTGKLLGNVVTPSDLLNSEVTLSDVNAELTIKLSIQPGHFPENVSKYEIVKFYSRSEVKVNDIIEVEEILGEEVLVAETTTLPYSQEYTTVTDFLSGLNLTLTDLRIGDKINFRVKVYATTGEVYYQGSSFSKYTVVINCASDLAGTYAINYTSGIQNHYITELSPGLYQIHSMMGWPTSDYAVTFTDTCGQLSIIDDWRFTNKIYGEGYVDTNGDIVWTTSGVENVYDDSSWTMIRQ